MNCPPIHEWDLLVLGALDEGEAGALLAHLPECPACRGVFEQARRAHADRIRMYDQFDRGHDSQREQLMAALPPEPARSRGDWVARNWRHMGDFAMLIGRRVGKRAAVGLVSAAACVAFVAWLVTFDGGPKAFAAALQQFQAAKTIVCRVSTPTPISVAGMTVAQDGKLYVSAEYGSRFENRTNGLLVNVHYTPRQGPVTVVNPLARNYMVIDTDAAAAETKSGNSPDEFIVALAKLQSEASRELGRKTLDGVEVLGYAISGQALGVGHSDRVNSELWVDAKTYRPVRYLAELPGPQGGAAYQLLFDQFEWDVPVDPQLFTPDIPADYARLDATIPASDEAALVKGLEHYAALAGKYPATLDMSSIVTDLASAVAARIAGAVARGEAAPDQQTLTQQSVEIGAGLVFYQRLIRDGATPEYHGETVTPGEADAVLVRWQSAPGTWRVIYGDLHTATVEEP